MAFRELVLEHSHAMFRLAWRLCGDENAADDHKCFSNATKTHCARFVGFVAVVAFIIGLVGCVYGALSFTGGNISAGEYSHSFDMVKPVHT